MVRKIKILHVLSSSSVSGAEKVAIDIIMLFRSNADMIYASPTGSIVSTLNEKDIQHVSIEEGIVDKKLRAAIKTHKPDIIHAHDMTATFKSIINSSRIPIISHLHGNPIAMSKPSFRSILFLLSSFKIKQVIAVSDSIIQDYIFSRLLNKNKINYIYNTINFESIQELIKIDESIYNCDFIYLGRLTYPKDPERVASVAAEVLKREPTLRFGLVGDGELRNNVINIFKNNGVFEQVELFGFLKNPYKVLSSSKVMLMCSRYEGTPLAALESLSLGVPIVSTPVDGIKKIVTNNINGFVSNNNDDLVNHLISILNDKIKHKEMSEAAISSSKRHIDSQEYCRQIKEVYEKCGLQIGGKVK